METVDIRKMTVNFNNLGARLINLPKDVPMAIIEREVEQARRFFTERFPDLTDEISEALDQEVEAILTYRKSVQ